MRVIARSLKALFIAVALSAANITAATSISPLEPDSTYSDTAREIVQRLESQHYSHALFNDDMSEKALGAYFKLLDPDHMYLLQSDIDGFAKYRHALDEALKTGDLDSGFVIFNVYRTRAVDRLEWVINNMHSLLQRMDYGQKDFISLDRKNATWPKDSHDGESLWTQQLKASALNLKLANKPQSEIEPLLLKRYKSQLDHLKQLNPEDAFEIYMNAVAAAYDPHTSYMSPEHAKNFDISMSLSLEGIGAKLEQDDEYTKVVEVIHGGPADKQGELKPADKITAVAQGDKGELVDVIGWRLDDVVALIRGEKGSVVRLQVIPANTSNTEKTKIIRIVRDTVKLEDQAAKKHVINISHGGKNHKVGVIDIPIFYMDFDAMRDGDPNFKSTTRDVGNLIQELQKDGVEGIVIDLRNNGGGSLQEANTLTGLFINNGYTVQIRNANGRIDRMGKPLGMKHYGGPMVVLIDRLSASASEIFAGAIQDYNRGVIVGSGSFGKGTVQSMLDIEHGKLKLTEAKFYRVSGASTQHRGVLPDVEFPGLYDPKLVGESSLDSALAWDTISEADHERFYPIPAVVGELRTRHEKRAKTDPDFVYMNDLKLYRGAIVSNKQLSLNEADRNAEEEKNKIEALAIENKRRIAKGQKPLTKLDSEDPEDDELASRNKKEQKPEEDAYLMESARVLVDAIELFNMTASRLH